MYTISAATAPGSEDLWAVFSALRLLEEAADAVAEAAVEAGRIAEDARWENRGTRKLRAGLMEMARQLRTESGQLRVQRDRVIGAVA